LYEGKINDGGVIGLETGDGFRQPKTLERLSYSERSQRVVGDQVKRPSEPNAIETHGQNPLGDGVHGLLAETLNHHGFEMCHPIHARQLHPLPGFVHNPP